MKGESSKAIQFTLGVTKTDTKTEKRVILI